MSNWYYVDDGGAQAGPVSRSDLQAGLQNGSIPSRTSVWREGMANWQPLADVLELSDLVPAGSSSPYAAPTSSSATAGSQPAGGKPENYLWQSIVVTILCCWPLGIPAIVYAAKVDSHWNAGRHQESHDAARNARTWTLVSLVAGLIFIACYAIIVFATGAQGVMS